MLGFEIRENNRLENLFFHYRTQIIVVFIFSLAIRLYILFNSYVPVYLSGVQYTYDLVHHSLFYEDMISKTPLYLDVYSYKYNPTTSYVLFLLTFPLLLTSLSFFEITVIGFAIVLSINAILNYHLLMKYFEPSNKLTIALLVIVNPLDLLSVLTWGGISLAITICSITAIILLQHNLDAKKAGIITLLLIMSASAHRTGMVIQLVFVLTFIMLNFRKITFSKEVIALLAVIFSLFSIFFVDRVYPLGMTYWEQVKTPTWGRSRYLISMLEQHLLLGILLLAIVGSLIYLLYIKRHSLKLYDVEWSYIGSCLLLFAVPVHDIMISSRFLVALNPILLIITVFYFRMLPRKFEGLLQTTITILGILIVQSSILITTTHLLEVWS